MTHHSPEQLFKDSSARPVRAVDFAHSLFLDALRDSNISEEVFAHFLELHGISEDIESWEEGHFVAMADFLKGSSAEVEDEEDVEMESLKIEIALRILQELGNDVQAASERFSAALRYVLGFAHIKEQLDALSPTHKKRLISDLCEKFAIEATLQTFREANYEPYAEGIDEGETARREGQLNQIAVRLRDEMAKVISA